MKMGRGLSPLWVASSINNLPAIQFDGGDEELYLGTSTAPETFVAVTRALTGGGLRGLWGNENNDKGVHEQDTQSRCCKHDNSSQNNGLGEDAVCRF